MLECSKDTVHGYGSEAFNSGGDYVNDLKHKRKTRSSSSSGREEEDNGYEDGTQRLVFEGNEDNVWNEKRKVNIETHI